MNRTFWPAFTNVEGAARLSAGIGVTLIITLMAGCERRPSVETTPVADFSRDISPIDPPRFAIDDWPWWRGPTRNGIARGAAPSEWSADRGIVWKTPVPGRGHSSPTVVGSRVFLATANDERQTQSVLAFNRATGEQLWQSTLHTGNLPVASQMNEKSTHANGTIACDGKRLFIAFLNDNTIWATALTLEGETIWQQALGDYAPRFGYAPSACVYGSLVLIAADHARGGYLAGVHRETGEVVWMKSRPAVDSYSSPVVATISGTDRLVISGAAQVTAYNPLSGEELWSTPGTAPSTCGTCVWDESGIYASGGYPDKQTLAVSPTGSRRWDNRSCCYEQSMLVHEGHLYAADDAGVMHCWDASTGEETWKGRLRGPISASPVLADEKLYVTNERGTTFVVAADPAEFRLLAENQLGSESFATPSICGGRIYHRVAAREDGKRTEWLYCIGNPSHDLPGDG